MSESTARAALFVGALSSSLIALGFIAQASKLGKAFDVFTLVILPTLYVLDVFTFARLVACSLEDLNYGRAINRIRGYYLELAAEGHVTSRSWALTTPLVYWSTWASGTPHVGSCTGRWRAWSRC